MALVRKGELVKAIFMKEGACNGEQQSLPNYTIDHLSSLGQYTHHLPGEWEGIMRSAVFNHSNK